MTEQERLAQENDFSFDAIYAHFDSAEKTKTGYVDFIELKDSDFHSEYGDDLEWGVEVVILSESHTGNHAVSFRRCSPMQDEDWKLGQLDDVCSELEMHLDSWYEFRYASEGDE